MVRLLNSGTIWNVKREWVDGKGKHEVGKFVMFGDNYNC